MIVCDCICTLDKKRTGLNIDYCIVSFCYILYNPKGLGDNDKNINNIITIVYYLGK